jgi:hypothetical protein
MYKLYKTTTGEEAVMKINEDGSSASFFKNPDNTDYQAYLAWVAEGNTPEPADEVTE